MYRGPGIGGLKKHAARKTQMKSLGEQQETDNVEKMQKQIESFQSNLSEFAVKHKDNINKNPVFRAKFHKMCKAIGVDPLASNKGIWADQLGLGDFYFELAVQVLEVCLRTKSTNGGIISVDDMTSIQNKKRSKKYIVKSRLHNNTSNNNNVNSNSNNNNVNNNHLENQVSSEDILEAVQRIHILGSAHRIVEIASINMIVSVATELDDDHTHILEIAQKCKGGFTIKQLAEELQWSEARAVKSIEKLVREGICWIDAQAQKDASFVSSNIAEHNQYKYWISSIWLSLQENKHFLED